MTAPQPRPHGLTRYKKGPDQHGTPGKGCRCLECRAANTAWQGNRDRMIAYGRWAALVPAAGTQRRLQALMRNGWSWGVLAARLGIPRQRLRAKLCRHQHVTPATAAAVRGLYDQLWDQPPPERTPHERSAATRSRRYAREHGFPPPLAWNDDEIDDPAASPADGWERREGVRRWGVLAEDAADLLRIGEEPAQVAERLGVTRSTLSTVLTRAAHKQARAA